MKMYFILAGVLSGIQNGMTLAHDGPGLAKVFGLIGLCFAMAYLYAGIRLQQLLATDVSQILMILLAGGLYLLVMFALAALVGQVMNVLPMVALSLAITWYLYANVRRLEAESRAALAASG
ncbi:MAG TPA: hypothetical protein VGT79_03150 [Xanthomonadaceae bacterium]|nr:hypothetical protein [Xanthomonadaceae bacterium]